MREEYDFTESVRNLYAKHLQTKKQCCAFSSISW